jgi:hypothetical protein
MESVINLMSSNVTCLFEHFNDCFYCGRFSIHLEGPAIGALPMFDGVEVVAKVSRGLTN